MHSLPRATSVPHIFPENSSLALYPGNKSEKFPQDLQFYSDLHLRISPELVLNLSDLQEILWNGFCEIHRNGLQEIPRDGLQDIPQNWFLYIPGKFSQENLHPRPNPCHCTVFIPGISEWRIFPRKFSKKSPISVNIFTGFPEKDS